MDYYSLNLMSQIKFNIGRDYCIYFINKNVDSWVLATLILLWAIIFPQYTGIRFNGDFKRLGSIESTLTRIIAILMLIGLFIVEFVFDNK